MNQIKKILLIARDKNLAEIIYFCLEGWGYEVDILKENPNLAEIKKKEPDLIILDFPFSHKEGLSLCREIKEGFVTSSLPLIVLIDKKQLRKHLLNLKHGIDDYLLKPPDPLDLRVRIEMALKRTQYSFYTNSLTNLPGGKIIEEILKEKITKREPFSFAHADIDNFKYFNDKYGYLKGDRVITQTAYILYQTVKKYGNPKDFIGHIGGDDFVFITSPDKEKIIASEFIYEFERLMPLHYSPEDRVCGYIEVEDRTNQLRKVPLMSISIAIVNNQQREFKNVVQINDALTELKSYLKKIPGSKFMVERRGLNQGRKQRRPSFSLIQNREVLDKKNKYLPLGQLLLNRGKITPYLLEELLDIHFKRAIPLGEILKDRGVIADEELQKFLSLQRKNS